MWKFTSILLILVSLVTAAPAPLPKPKRVLVKEDMIGLWVYKYGVNSVGIIFFDKNGTYHARLPQGEHIGEWSVNKEEKVILLERVIYFDQETGLRSISDTQNEYIFTFDIGKNKVFDSLSGMSTYKNSAFSIPVNLERIK